MTFMQLIWNKFIQFCYISHIFIYFSISVNIKIINIEYVPFWHTIHLITMKRLGLSLLQFRIMGNPLSIQNLERRGREIGKMGKREGN